MRDRNKYVKKNLEVEPSYTSCIVINVSRYTNWRNDTKRTVALQKYVQSLETEW